MTVLVLHLSDLHVKIEESSFWTDQRAQLIARSAARTGPYEAVVVIISGDIAYAGQTDEYVIAESFINAIAAELTTVTKRNPKIAIAPGNHDCDFSVSSKLRSFARSQKSDETTGDSEMLAKLCEPLINYRNFEAKVETVTYPERTLLHKSTIFDVNATSIQLRVWSSAAYSEKGERKGELYLPPQSFEEGWHDTALRIAVMHHPPAWFADPASRDIRSALRAHSHIILFGHEHYPEIGETVTYRKSGANEALEVDGPVLHPHEADILSSFISFELDVPSAAICANSHTWDDVTKRFQIETLTDLQRNKGWTSIPRKSKPFTIGSKFEDDLLDPGMSIVSKTGRRITLRDLYVAPELAERISLNSHTEEISSAETLLDPTKLKGGVVIQGDEKVGKSALLFRLFSLYHEAGLVPVYIALRDHKIKTAQDFQKVLATSIKKIYPHEEMDAFAATSKHARLLLIDDIDVLTKPELITQLISFVNSQFDLFVATTTLKTQLTEVLTNDGTGALGGVRHLKWVKFSYLKRAQLIGLWVKLVEEIEDTEQVIARLDYLEKSANATLGHNLVPRVPQMLLIFLQSTSATSSTKLESGALANYYTYLVTKQLLDAGVRADELEEYISFSRIVSYFMYSTDKAYITTQELEQCNSQFGDEFYPGAMQNRLNVLRSARLLGEFGDGAYQWRHSYFHYLFLGGYLSTNGEDKDVNESIEKMCKHLYVRSNANALLFLVHFSRDRKVFDILRSVIADLFKSAKPLKLGEDTKAFGEIIRNAKALSVPSNVMGEREKRNKALDDSDAQRGDGLRDSPKGAATILENLIVLFKTSEILGQVLKEQYASITRAQREPIVVALADAYMRAAGTIIRDIALNKKSLQDYLVRRIDGVGSKLSDEERMTAAQMLVSDLLQMFMFAFFQKLGESLSSDKTLDLIRHIKWPDAIEPKVFLLACELNLQRPLPLARIDEILMVADKDKAFVALVRNLVQVRVSLFHTKAPELQALAQRFNIDVNSLNAIDFRESKSR